MAITVTSRGTSFSTTNSSPYTATVTAPTANRVQLAFVLNSATSAPPQPTLTSTGLTWQAIATVLFGTIATPLRRLTAYRAQGASPSGTTVTITITGSPTACAWSFAELNGVDTTGVSGINAIADSTVSSVNGGTTLSTLNLGGIVFTGDAVIAGFGLDTTSLVAPAEGFTEIAEATFSTPTGRIQTQYHLTYDTTPTATWTASNSAGIALELKAIENAFKSNPKPGEVVTLGESIQVNLGANPQATDTTTLTDDATVEIWQTDWLGTVDLLLMPQRAESLTLTDTLTNLTMVGGTTPSVADSVTLTDTTTVKGLIIPVQAADVLTITEKPPDFTLSSASVWAINVSDQVTLTETLTPHLLTQPQPVAELMTLTDTRTVNLVNQPFAADSTTPTDTVTLQLLINPRTAESVTITDNVSITGLIILIPAATDVVTFGDDAQGIPTGTIPFDNFDDNAQNSAFWDVAATRAATDALVLVSETAHQLRITPRTNAGAVDAYNGYRAVYPSNYTNEAVFAEIPQVANSATTARTSLVLAIDTANGYDITQEAGQLYFEYEIGNITTVGLQIAYVPATHRWWRIRHVSAGDTIRYDTSPTGTVWTQQLSIPRPASLPVTSLHGGVQAGTYVSVASPGVAVFDNINLTTLTIFPAESLTLTDTPAVKGLIPKALGAELVTLTESKLIVFGGTLLINRAESVTLTDFSEAELVAPFADLVTVTDSALVQRWVTSWDGTVNLLAMPHSADSVTLLDAVSFPTAAVWLINVNDTATVTDTSTVKGIILGIAAADSSTLTDTALVSGLLLTVSRADLVTLTDPITVNGLTLPMTPVDTVTLTDQLAIAGLVPAIATADTVTLTDSSAVAGLRLLITTAEILTLTDDGTVQLPIAGVWQASVSDSSSLTDTTTVTGLTLKPPAAESVTLTDLTTTNLLSQPKGSDSLTTTDVVTTWLFIQPHPSESVTLTDSVVITGLTLKPISADTVILTDTSSFSTNIIRADTVTLTDTAFVPGLRLKVIATDVVTLSEQRIVFAGLKLGDLVTVSESLNIFVIGGVLTEPLILFTVPARDFTVEAVVGFTQFIVPARDFTVEAAANPLVFTVPARDFTVEAVVGFTQFIVPARDFTVEAAA